MTPEQQALVNSKLYTRQPKSEATFAAPSGSANRLLEMVRLQAPERVRQDAKEPGKPRVQIVIDDGINAGMLIATCEYEQDAALLVEMWNYARTLSPNDRTLRPAK